MPRRVLTDTHTRITAEHERKLKRRVVQATTDSGGDTYGPIDPTDGIQNIYWNGTDTTFSSSKSGYYFTNAVAGASQIRLSTLVTNGTALEYVEGTNGGLIQMNVDGLYWLEAAIHVNFALAAGEHIQVNIESDNATAELSDGPDGYVQAYLWDTPMTHNKFGRPFPCRAGSQFSFSVAAATVASATQVTFRAQAYLLGAGTVL